MVGEEIIAAGNKVVVAGGPGEGSAMARGVVVAGKNAVMADDPGMAGGRATVAGDPGTAGRRATMTGDPDGDAVAVGLQRVVASNGLVAVEEKHAGAGRTVSGGEVVATRSRRKSRESGSTGGLTDENGKNHLIKDDVARDDDPMHGDVKAAIAFMRARVDKKKTCSGPGESLCGAVEEKLG